MTKDVKINIEGIDVSTQEKIVTNGKGIYKELQGKHFLYYDELAPDNSTVRSVIKFNINSLSVRKDGISQSYMVFQLKTATEARYGSPYGYLNFEVETDQYVVEIHEDMVKVSLSYRLMDKGHEMSSNQLKIIIEPLK